MSFFNLSVRHGGEKMSTAMEKPCVLIITEKPDAAERIAKALDLQGKPVKRKEKGVPFFEAYRVEMAKRRNHDELPIPVSLKERNPLLLSLHWFTLQVQSLSDSFCSIWLLSDYEHARFLRWNWRLLSSIPDR